MVAFDDRAGYFIDTEMVICKCFGVSSAGFTARWKFAIVLAVSNLSRIYR